MPRRSGPTSGTSCGVDEALHPFGVDLVPGVTVALQVRSDDAPVSEPEVLGDGRRLRPGVEEDRHARVDRLAHVGDGLDVRSAPAMGPDTKMTSAKLETTVERAICAGVRLPIGDANSGVMLAKIARSSRAKLRRSRNSVAASGFQGPMSDSHAPVTTSRMKDAPDPTAIASAHWASQR